MTYKQGDANYSSSNGEHQSTTQMRIRGPASRLDKISQQSNDRHCRIAESWKYPETFRNGSYPPPTMALPFLVPAGPSHYSVTLTPHSPIIMSYNSDPHGEWIGVDYLRLSVCKERLTPQHGTAESSRWDSRKVRDP